MTTIVRREFPRLLQVPNVQIYGQCVSFIWKSIDDGKPPIEAGVGDYRNGESRYFLGRGNTIEEALAALLAQIPEGPAVTEKPGRVCTNCGRQTPRKNMLCGECADAYREQCEKIRDPFHVGDLPIRRFTLPEGWRG